MTKLRKIILFIVIVGFSASAIFVWLSIHYEDNIIALLKSEINKNVRTEITTDNIKVSPFKHFPFISVSFKNILIKSNKPEEIKQPINDTLLFAENFSVSVNLKSLLQNEIKIKQIICEDGALHIIDFGQSSNYAIFQQAETSENSFAINMEDIAIENIKFDYINYNNNVGFRGFSNKIKAKLNRKTGVLDIASKYNISKFSYILNGENKFYGRKLNGNISFNYLDNSIEINNIELDIDNNKYELSGKYDYQNNIDTRLNIKGNIINISSIIKALNIDNKNDIDGRCMVNSWIYWDSASGGMRFSAKTSLHNIEMKFTQDEELRMNGECEIQYDFKNVYNSALQFSAFNMSYGSSKLSSDDLRLTRFANPYVKGNVNVTLKCTDINNLINNDLYIFESGTISSFIYMEGKLPEEQKSWQNYFSALVKEGYIKSTGVNIKKANQEQRIELNYAGLRMDDNLTIDSADLKINSTKVLVNGSIPNFSNSLLKNKAKIILNIKGESVFTEDLMYLLSDDGLQKETSKEPFDISLLADCTIKKYYYNNIEFRNCTGNIQYTKDDIRFNITRAELKEGSLSGKAHLEILSNSVHKVSIYTDVNSVDLNYVFKEFKEFNQSFITSDHVSGSITGTFDIGFKYWDSFSNILKESVVLNSSVIVSNGVLTNFEPILKLSNYIDINELKSIRFSELKNNIYILDQVIYIPEMQVKSSALNLYVSGEHSFKSEYDYNFRLKLFDILSKKFRLSAKHRELNIEAEDDPAGIELFFTLSGDSSKSEVKYNKAAHKMKIHKDIEQEKSNVKSILNEEFGLYSKSVDSLKRIDKLNSTDKTEQKKKQDFIIEWDDE